jgi:flagellar biosynthetic protein FliR
MGLVLNLGMGLANRMMPALPVFFVATPVLVAAGLFVLIVAAPSILEGFLDRFAAWLGTMRF